MNSKSAYPYSCPWCEYEFRKKRYLGPHVFDHHAEKVVNRDVSYSGGGFHESLWNADPRYPNNSDNPYGADGTNKEILQAAGVYKSEEGLIA